MRRPNAVVSGAFAVASVVAVLATTACTGTAKTDGTAAIGVGSATVRATTAQTIKVEDSALGKILTNQDGLTLYAFANDRPGSGRSSCTGECIATWPAVLTGEKPQSGPGVDATKLSTITRDEGTEQVRYGNWPLYLYAGDQGPQDVDGQAVDGVWWAISPDGNLVKTSAAS